MATGAGWRLVEQYFEDEKNYEAKVVNWLQTAYEGQCEMQANPHLFSLPCVAFAPVERELVRGDQIGLNFRQWDEKVYTKKKAFQISANKASAKQYSWLMDMKIDLPYITATMWQRPKKKIAWMLLVKNARVIKKLATVREIHSFYLVCEEISEMMPKDLLPPPEYDSSLLKHLERF